MIYLRYIRIKIELQLITSGFNETEILSHNLNYVSFLNINKILCNKSPSSDAAFRYITFNISKNYPEYCIFYSVFSGVKEKSEKLRLNKKK